MTIPMPNREADQDSIVDLLSLPPKEADADFEVPSARDVARRADLS